MASGQSHCKLRPLNPQSISVRFVHHIPVYRHITAQNGMASTIATTIPYLTLAIGSSCWWKETKEEVVKRQRYGCELASCISTPHLTPRIVKDKANHAVVLDKATADKLQKDVQSYRLITVAVLVDRLKINGSLARQAMKDLEEKGLIKKVVGHSKMQIYSKSSQMSC
jgi:small subunit ribosomal protein S25e